MTAVDIITDIMQLALIFAIWRVTARLEAEE
jgi:hypothetical protein